MPSRLRPMTHDDLVKLRSVGRPALSPDGRRVVFELKRADAKANRNFTQLMIVSNDGTGLRSLTAGKYNYTRPAWSPDGRSLAFISDREKGQCLFVMRMDGGEALRITEPDGVVHDFAWSPDSRRLAYTWQPMNEREKLERDGKNDEVARRPQFKHVTRLFHKLDGAGWWNGQYTHVWVCNADGSARRQLTRGDHDHSEPRWSPDGLLISFLSNRTPNPDMNSEHLDVFAVRPTGGGLRQLKTANGSCRGHAWSPDGRWIAYVGACFPRGKGWQHLERIWLLPARGGKPKELTREIDNLCRHMTLGDVVGSGFEVCPVIWSGDSERVFFLVSEAGATRLYSRSITRRDLRCEAGGNVNIYFAQRTRGDGPIAVSLGTITDPGDIYLVEPGAAAEQSVDAGRRASRPLHEGNGTFSAHAGPCRLTRVNEDALRGVFVQEPREIRVRSGEAQVQAWIMTPPGFDPKRKYPAILQIHGGPHAQYGYSFFHEFQWLAGLGYVVCFSNPRGSSGFGLRYMNCIHADWGNIDYRDVMRVADWLFDRPFVDRTRVGVTGGSYGGYMTNWLVTHTQRFAAAVTQRCVSNLESMFGTSDYGFDLGTEFGGLPWESRELYRRQSPLTFVANCRTPLLIEHQEQDHRCPPEQGEQMFASLKVLGREVEMIRFEGESHGMVRGGRPQNRLERLRRIEAWFAKYMPQRAPARRRAAR